MEELPNILAQRYASNEMVSLWSPQNRILEERRLWVAILESQKNAGLHISPEAIKAYKAVTENIDMDSIRAREAQTHHDVKARIDEFCALAGHEEIHQGLTSRDLTESIEQKLLLKSLKLILDKSISLLHVFSRRIDEFKTTPLVARTHNVPAQITTLGRRLAMFAEELLFAIEALEALIQRFPARGIKGAIGTQIDLYQLFDGDENKIKTLEEDILAWMGLTHACLTPGQIYPRSLDFSIVATFLQLSSGPASFAKTFRLMAGQGLASESFNKGQTGSSAMPHKNNPRLSERIASLQSILRGHLAQASDLLGNQWNEGDVACSAVRRVMLPDACFTLDGILETCAYIMAEASFNAEAMKAEVTQELPYLLSSSILAEATAHGVGREKAHEQIKKYTQMLHNKHGSLEEFLALIAKDTSLSISYDFIATLKTNPLKAVGPAVTQTEALLRHISHCHKNTSNSLTPLKTQPL